MRVAPAAPMPTAKALPGRRPDPGTPTFPLGPRTLRGNDTGILDGFEDPRRLAEDLGGVEPEHPDAVSAEPQRPLLVLVDTLPVIRAVDFHDHTRLRTVEVREVGADWRLAPKLEPGESPRPKVAPEDALGL